MCLVDTGGCITFLSVALLIYMPAHSSLPVEVSGSILGPEVDYPD
jgi:hypothetical protein